jgi:hypothetical protein
MFSKRERMPPKANGNCFSEIEAQPQFLIRPMCIKSGEYLIKHYTTAF